MTEQKTTNTKAKVKLTVSQVQQDLRDGRTRDEIGEKYGLSKADVKMLFQHPQLKGKKTKPSPSFDLIDDTAEANTATAKVDTTKAPKMSKAEAEAKTNESNAKAEEQTQGASEEVDKEQAPKPEEKLEEKKGLW